MLEDHFAVSSLPSVPARYNIPPGQKILSIRHASSDHGESVRRSSLLQWGLVPFWADDTGIGNNLINARSETVDEKPSFRNAFGNRHCLIAADGFYEWSRQNGGKQPYYLTLTEDRPFGFAGIWESWKDEEEDTTLETCALLTTEPNQMVEPIHDRMPVILPPEDYDKWLSASGTDRELKSLLKPYPADQMEAYPVRSYVNNPENDDPRCVEPLEE